jgi:hypothetical protein
MRNPVEEETMSKVCRVLIFLLGSLLVGCGTPVNPTSSPAAVVVMTKDGNGLQQWTCLAVDGGEANSPASLSIWLPDDKGNCWKEKK